MGIREREFCAVKRTIKHFYNSAKYGIFNRLNVTGDDLRLIYHGTYFNLLICDYYEYFEIFGTTSEEFDELYEFYINLGKEGT